MLEQFEKIGEAAKAELKKVTDAKQLEEFRINRCNTAGQRIPHRQNARHHTNP